MTTPSLANMVLAKITPSEFQDWHQRFRTRFEHEIAATLDRGLTDAPARLGDAIRHAALDGGKRLRPLLVLLACQLGVNTTAEEPSLPDLDSPDLDEVWPAAVAIELIHVYSLIHDDLPSMDDDDLRRGRPTVHRAFDEATAILAGDALQSLAFEQLASAPTEPDVRLTWVRILSHAAGPAGMVGGQQIDLDSEQLRLPLDRIERLHEMKTGQLIRAALLIGAAAGGLSSEQTAALDRFGRELGLAFQIQDDILDVTGSADSLGKTPGKDAAADKNSFVRALGLKPAQEALQNAIDQAMAAIAPFGERARALTACAHFVMTRTS